jgi:uncharacterized protein
MNIEETFTLDAPVQQVYAFLSDVHRVAGCVPGVGDLTQRDDGAFEATLQVQMGPMRAAFAGEVSLETSENPYHITAEGRGQDRKSGSRAEVTFSGALEPENDDVTRVVTSADITIRGRLGQFGTGVIRATATEVIREFVTCANEVLQEEAAAAAAPGPPAGQAPAAPGAAATPAAERTPRPRSRVTGRLVLRILVSWLRDIGRRLVEFVRGRWRR